MLEMNEIIDFIINNWQTAVVVLFSFLFFILQVLFKKKPILFYDSVKTTILQFAAAVVNKVENQGFTNSSDKLNSAIAYLYSITSSNLTFEEWCKLYKDYAIKVIEDVLSTPQKKGSKCE